jgi:hypothetical protein
MHRCIAAEGKMKMDTVFLRKKKLWMPLNKIVAMKRNTMEGRWNIVASGHARICQNTTNFILMSMASD